MERTASTQRPHFVFLDGLRGLTALYVVVFHVFHRHVSGLHGLSLYMASPLLYGHDAVTIFIVLSGFCLNLPLVGPHRPRLRKGLGDYFIRRIRRVLPAYYASLLISAGITFLWILVLRVSSKAVDPGLIQSTSLRSLASHLLLVHNWSKEFIVSLNPPTWSVAVEFQIYVLFPFVLLPMLQRTGLWGLICGGFLIGLGPHFLLPQQANFDWTCPWYIALFCLGMASAHKFHSDTVSAPTPNVSRAWNYALYSSLLAYLSLKTWFQQYDSALLSDIVLGVTVSIFLGLCVRHKQRGQSLDPTSTRFLSLLETPISIKLGEISYSLYLIHFPILMLCIQPSLLFLRMSENSQLAIRLCVGIPLSIWAGAILYWLIERRYRQRRESK